MSYVPMKGLPRDALDIVTYHGRTMDRLTMQFLIEMERILGYPLTVIQGCYNTSVKASGTTHKGGGVVDLADYKWEGKVEVGADLGGFPYHRDELPGTWGEHVHMGIRNHPKLDPMAVTQQQDWDHKPPLNGLRGHAPLTGQYHPGKQIEFDYKEAVAPVPTQVQVARSEIVQSISSVQDSIAIVKGLENRPAVYKKLPRLRAVRTELKDILDDMPDK